MWLKPRILGADDSPPPLAVMIDGFRPGAEVTLSHWQDAPTLPAGITGDTGTDLALSANNAPYLTDGLEWVVNDHLDVDGVIAMAALVDQPTANATGGLLARAAASADFNEWHDRPAQRLAWGIAELITRCRADGGDWQQVVLDHICGDLTGTLSACDRAEPAIEQAIDQLESTIADLRAGTRHRVSQHAGLVVIDWDRDLGHAWDVFNQVPKPDDLPIAAIHGAFGATWALCAERHADGIDYALLAPGHSWARTMTRPSVAWPDLSALASSLSADDRSPWLTRPAAMARGFTCLLASESASQREPTDVAELLVPVLPSVP